MTIWDELIIADYESKWLDPDYDFANRCYRSDEEAAETDTREMPLTEDEEYEDDPGGLLDALCETSVLLIIHLILWRK